MRRRNLRNYGRFVFSLRCRHAFQIFITKNVASDSAAPAGVICLCAWITHWFVVLVRAWDRQLWCCMLLDVWYFPMCVCGPSGATDTNTPLEAAVSSGRRPKEQQRGNVFSRLTSQLEMSSSHPSRWLTLLPYLHVISHWCVLCLTCIVISSQQVTNSVALPVCYQPSDVCYVSPYSMPCSWCC